MHFTCTFFRKKSDDFHFPSLQSLQLCLVNAVNAGQFVYVYCSANEFTTGVPDENAKLNITVK